MSCPKFLDLKKAQFKTSCIKPKNIKHDYANGVQIAKALYSTGRPKAITTLCFAQYFSNQRTEFQTWVFY